MNKNFELQHTSGTARAGVLHTRHGSVQTPFFMTVGTQAAVKAGVTAPELVGLGTPVLLCNTYHLHLRPGSGVVQRAGGLHGFAQWQGPILTDSGGFQVYSLQRKKITEEGVKFRSHIDGASVWLDAEESMRIQHELGADIVMAFDDCPPNYEMQPGSQLTQPLTAKPVFLNPEEKRAFFRVKNAVDRTTRWAKRSIDAHFTHNNPQASPTQRAQIFGIVQGGCFPGLRQQSAQEITALPFDGFALGGLAVGESHSAMYAVLNEMTPRLPADKPRYLMGVGTPENMLEAIDRGIDMFDCVLPMRNARHGLAYTSVGKVRPENAPYRESQEVLDPNCDCPTCSGGFTRGYLHHLLRAGEALGPRLLTQHNIAFYNRLIRDARTAIQQGTYAEYKQQMIAQMAHGDGHI